MKSLQDALQEEFGYQQFREGQEEIIEAVLSGNDVLAVLPTGSGKTICYHLPAKLLGGLTVVISPLVSLMEDQVTQMKASGDKAVAHISSLVSSQDKKEILKDLNNYHMIFVSPEMISVPYIKQLLMRQKIDLFVVDEAHCISQWGHEFRTDYLRLSDVRKQLGNPPCLALTATATLEVERDIRHHLNMKNGIVCRFPVNRPNIFLEVETVEYEKEKDELFLRRMETIKYPTIVYSGTRKRAVYYAAMLRKKGMQKVAFYHGGMDKEDRLLIQQQFIRDELDVICCTNAFGMGINKPNVRSVIHLNLPSSVEQYVQEIGRAGRDNNQSLALIINCEKDRILPLSFIENEFPENYLIEQLMRDTIIEGRTVEEVQQLNQMNETQWKMLVYYLEQINVINNNRFILLGREEEVLAEIIDYFEKRKSEKIILLDQMNRLIKSEACIRADIATYFSDPVIDSPNWCCSYCHSSNKFNDWFKLEIDKSPHLIKMPVAELKDDWKSRLKNMLLIETES
ncbi:RecQ family ATP-dependent DNA helicase [Salipaludibacillus sp. HK11]|uniref:RecQ family ATP-dependent DNA helicase n=1 Tax=Salipaludibacillus sp. HK11 TaxID=3394320 RepID=UPI0039FD8E8C